MKSPYYIKYCKGLFSEAQKQKKLRLLLAYYRLKTLNVEGSIKRKGSLSLLCSTLLLSESQTYQTIQKLKQLGWIRVSKTHIELVKLDYIVSSFGLDPSMIKRWKIQSNKSKDFYNLFGLVEISFSIQLQNREIEKNLREVRSLTDTDKKPENLLRVKQKEQIKLIRKQLSNNFTQNWFSTLSTIKVAEILGYQSPMSAWSYLKELDSKGFISYTSNKPLFITHTTNIKYYYSLNLDNSFFITSTGVVLKQLPNTISIL